MSDTKTSQNAKATAATADPKTASAPTPAELEQHENPKLLARKIALIRHIADFLERAIPAMTAHPSSFPAQSINDAKLRAESLMMRIPKIAAPEELSRQIKEFSDSLIGHVDTMKELQRRDTAEISLHAKVSSPALYVCSTCKGTNLETDMWAEIDNDSGLDSGDVYCQTCWDARCKIAESDAVKPEAAAGQYGVLFDGKSSVSMSGAEICRLHNKHGLALPKYFAKYASSSTASAAAEK